MTQGTSREWVDDLEIANANIKWGFSRFAGQADMYNEEGDHNFVVIIPPEEAAQLREIGWNVKEKMALEEGDPPENHLQVRISFRKEPPLIYFIKNNRRFSVDHPSELKQIKRATCENLDVIIQPSFWGPRPDGSHGISAYVKEMYVTIRESRFASQYSDFEEVHSSPASGPRAPRQDDEG